MLRRLWACAIMLFPAGIARAAGLQLKLTPIATELAQPVEIKHAGDGSGRLFVVEQAGRIMIVNNGGVMPIPFLDIRHRVTSGGEMGLLGVAFHPKFQTNGRFVVDYTARDDNGWLKTVVAEYHVLPDDPNRAALEERVILTVTQPFANHNGGQVQFGPDGFLYIALGDGGGAGDQFGNGQNIQTLLGKILRVDIDGMQPYGIPPGNPFVDKPGMDEIWAYGLRNPWRFSFDRATGTLFAADVGQDRFEEIDVIVGGGNYGWNRMEGRHCFPPTVETCNPNDFIQPIAEYDHTEGVSVTGGYVYRGSAIPELNGMYIFGDYGYSTIWGLHQINDQWKRTVLLRAPKPISSFGEDEAGELYVVGYDGTIFKLESMAQTAQPTS